MSSSMGDVILVLRRAANLSQEILAQRLGITQAALSRYENNLRQPDESMSESLAAEFMVTRQFLEHDFSMHGAIAADAHMRRQRTSRPADWKRVEARLNAYRMHSTYILNRMPLDCSVHVPHVDPDDVAPTEAAASLRASWRMPIGPVRDLVKWVEAAGVMVIEEDFGTQRVDGLTQWSGDHAVILVNSAMPTDRKRWTIAHELGHLVLHSGHIDSFVEDQANSFASEFLMPEHVIRPQLTNLTLGKLIDLKAEWRVSMQAIYERAYELGAVTSDERAAFYRNLNRRGWKVREPHSEELPRETPRLAASLGERLRAANLRDHEVAAILGVRPGASTPFDPPKRALRAVH